MRVRVGNVRARHSDRLNAVDVVVCDHFRLSYVRENSRVRCFFVGRIAGDIRLTKEVRSYADRVAAAVLLNAA